MEITDDKQKKRMKRNGENLTDLRDSIKCSNIFIIEGLEGEERERGTENIFENIIPENFPKLRKETDTQV